MRFLPDDFIGKRVKLTKYVERYPHFAVDPRGRECLGTIVSVDGTLAVKLDDYVHGAEDNDVCWTVDDLGHELADSPPEAVLEDVGLELIDDPATAHLIATRRRRQRVVFIIQEAERAFWSKVAELVPEAEHGDFTPDADDAFKKACRKAVATWLALNLPVVCRQCASVEVVEVASPTQSLAYHCGRCGHTWPKEA